jgi:hypothetical protein
MQQGTNRLKDKFKCNCIAIFYFPLLYLLITKSETNLNDNWVIDFEHFKL